MKAHKNNTKTFSELTPREQTYSLIRMGQSFERAANAKARSSMDPTAVRHRFANIARRMADRLDKTF
jgi:hypothetical protein